MSTRSPKGSIAAGHQLTAEAGATMLRSGGNAIDAAIAALAMACVCEPVLASPGGGGFAMVRSAATGKTALLDFFPQTPRQKRDRSSEGFQSITADFGAATQVFHIGPATVAAPGFPAGLAALRRQGGTFSFADLFAPAIEAARTGHAVTGYQHYLSTVVRPILTATEAARALFAATGDVPAAGSVFRNPGLARAYKELAQGDWLQTDVAEQILKMQETGGHLTRDDLTSYRVEPRRPLSLKLGGAAVHLNPPPAAGGALIRYALSHLEGCGRAAFAGALDAADRARTTAHGDLKALIDAPIRQQGTTHISTVDAHGNACSVTVSNGTGNGEIVSGCGFMLNNILGEEDVNPNGSADWPANRRLASMMCPALIDMPDGRLIALGSGGSSRIRSAVFQVVARLCLDGAALEDAVFASRLHVEDGHLDVEMPGAGSDINALKDLFPDHRLWPEKNMFFGGVHAVSTNGRGSFSGIGDSRREGAAVIVA